MYTNKQKSKPKYQNKIKVEKPKFNFQHNHLLNHLTPIHKAPTPAIKYLVDRKLTNVQIAEFYWTPNFKKFINDHVITGKYEHPEIADERVVLPILDEDKSLTGFLGRDITGEHVAKYFAIKIDEDGDKLIYGKHKLNLDKQVYVVEGAFDSFFIPNCVAAMNAALHLVTGFDDPVLIWDNEPRNKDVMRQMEEGILAGKKVLIWDDKNPYKDINEMVMNGMVIDQNFLDTHTYQGLQAEFKFGRYQQ
jgi:hypothetical protein